MNALKYTILFSVILGLVSCQQEVSPEQAEKFIKFYGNAMMDEAKDIEVLSDGAYAICGIDSTSGEGKRAVLIVTDTYGNMRSGFPQYYSMGGNNTGANTLVVKNGGQGGFLLAGYVDVPSGDSTQRDLFLVRTSSSGRELWKQSFGTEEDEAVLHATELISSNGFVLAGYAVKNGKQDIMIKVVDDQGSEMDLSLNYPSPSHVQNAAANYVYNTGENYFAVCTYNKVGSDGTKMIVLVMNADLSPMVVDLVNDYDEVGKCVAAAGDDQFLILGNRIDVRGKVETVIHMIETEDYFPIDSYPLATISESKADLIAQRLLQTRDGRFAIVGTRRAEGNSDIFLQFLESDFSVAERILYGESGDQLGADIAQPLEEGLILLGTNGFGANSLISLIRTDVAGNL
jgi:hypothetical protein